MTKINEKDVYLIDAFTAKIKQYTKERKLSLYGLAQLSNIPYTTIKNIMQKRVKDITFKTIILLAHGLGITPSELINDECFLAENLDLD